MDKVPNGLATFRLGILRMLVCFLTLKRPENPSSSICFDFAYTTNLLEEASLNISLTPLVVQPPALVEHHQPTLKLVQGGRW